MLKTLIWTHKITHLENILFPPQPHCVKFIQIGSKHLSIRRNIQNTAITWINSSCKVDNAKCFFLYYYTLHLMVCMLASLERVHSFYCPGSRPVNKKLFRLSYLINEYVLVLKFPPQFSRIPPFKLQFLQTR